MAEDGLTICDEVARTSGEAFNIEILDKLGTYFDGATVNAEHVDWILANIRPADHTTAWVYCL